MVEFFRKDSRYSFGRLVFDKFKLGIWIKNYNDSIEFINEKV